MKRILRQFKPGMVIMLGIFLVLFTTASAWAEITTLSSAINKAGRQRMLTQRIVKAYCLAGMGVQASTHWKQRDAAIDLFETQLAELKAFAPTAEIADGLAQVEALWGPFKAIAAAPPTKDGADMLLAINDQVLAAAHQVVVLLAQHSGTETGHLVNISGRQRMLSQRLAKFYMARAWGIQRPEIQGEMRKAAKEFEAALLRELVPSPQNTPEIQDELAQAVKQWNLYKRGLALEKDSGDYIPVIMAATSEKLLKIMNKITGMYEKLSAG
jgi:nitrate/nitrite-specific signal transduction histidine kinase